MSDTDTLSAMIDVIKSEPVQAILVVIKATNVTSSMQNMQKQLRTLEYILGPKLWDHVLTPFTFWGFSWVDIKKRVRTCLKEKKSQFGETFEGRRISVNNWILKIRRSKKYLKALKIIWE